MISWLKVNNFKSNEKQDFQMKPITILTGLNSTGKSSIIQSILLLSADSSSSSLLKEHIKIFSNFNIIRNRYINAQEVLLSVECNKQVNKITIEKEKGWNNHNLNSNKFLQFDKNLHYISANRIGQEELASFDEDIKFGIDGKYVFGYFERNKDKLVDNNLLAYKEHNTLDAQLSYWLKYILDIDLRIITEKITQSNIKVTYESDGLDNISPFNLGAGNSYLAKVLIMGLSRKKNSILIVENPEIHLHPKAQAKIADFFVFLQNAGIQIILETHSEHLINKFRYNVYKNNLSHNDIIIYYKQTIKEKFQQININKNAHFVDIDNRQIEFPSGFFDSTLSELLEIM